MNLVERLIEADCRNPKTILVVGDPMTDVYVHGQLYTGCQDRCEKFVEELHVTVPGGASNANRSLQHWSAQKIFPLGDLGGPTKMRFMIEDRCIFRHDNDYCNFDLATARVEALLCLSRSNPDAVLISDYDKGVLTLEFINRVVTICTQRKIPCVADVKRAPEVYEGAIIKGNWDWYERNTSSPRNRVITDGCHLPYVNDEVREVDNLPRVKCINHVGAGDCFAAHLTLALAYGFFLKEAAAIAHSAGRVYVQHPHNRPPHPHEIVADLSSAT